MGKLERVCEEKGISLLKVAPAYTSQTCSVCGFQHKDNRKNEKFLCGKCGIEMDADYNAAINILHRGVYSPSAINMKKLVIFDNRTSNYCRKARNRLPAGAATLVWPGQHQQRVF